jgi:hypothetical protein
MPKSDAALDAYLGITTEDDEAPRGPKKRTPSRLKDDPALDAYLSTAPPPPPPGPVAEAWARLKDMPSPREAVAAIHPTEIPAGLAAMAVKAKEAFDRHALDPRPTWGQQVAEAMPDWLKRVPLATAPAGALEVGAKLLRGLSGIAPAVAEFGPEQAKPLTEVGVNILLGGRDVRGMAARTMGAATPDVATAVRGLRKPPPVPPPPKPMLALPETTSGARPMGPTVDNAEPLGPVRKYPRAQYGGQDVELKMPPRVSPEREAEIVSDYMGGAPKRPAEPAAPGLIEGEGPAAPPGRLVDAEGEPIRGRRPARKVDVGLPTPPGTTLKAPRPSAADLLDAEGNVIGAAPGAVDLGPPTPSGAVRDAQGRLVVEPPPGATGTRQKLRSMYKGREPERIDLTGAPPAPLPDWFDPSRLPPRRPEPPPPPEMPPGMPPPPPPGSPSPSGRPAADPGVFGIEMDKPGAPMPPPAKGPTPNPELALRDYAAPGGTKVYQQIGGELVEWTKTDRNEWQGWVAGAHRKLTGESALNLAANPPPRVGPPTGPEIQANQIAAPPRVPVAPQVPEVPAQSVQIKSPPPPREVLPVNPRALPVKPPTPQVPGVRPDEPLPPMAAPARPPSDVQPPPPGAPSVGPKPAVKILQTPEGEPIARLRNVDSPGRGMGTWEVEEWIDGPGASRPLPFQNLEGSDVVTYGDYFKGRVAPKLHYSKTGEVSREGAKLGYLQTASADAKYLADVPLEAPPSRPRFEPTAIGDQALIGGTPDKAAPPTGLKAKVAQADIKAEGLFGQERTAREAANEAAQGGLEIGMRGRQQAAVNEWIMDQLGGTYGIALTRAKSPGSIQPAVVAKLKSLGIDPADAWNATHMEVPPPGVLDRLAELSVPKPALEAPMAGQGGMAGILDELLGPPGDLGSWNPKDPWPAGGLSPKGPKPALEAPKPLEMVNTFTPDVAPLPPPPSAPRPPSVGKQRAQKRGLWEETGSPDLNDPDHVAALIQGYGKLRVTEDRVGELRNVPAYFKSKNGLTHEQMAQAILEDYPHLMGGDVGAVSDQVLDVASRYKELRRDKAARTAKDARAFDVKAQVPGQQQGPGAAPLSKEDTLFNKALEWWDQIGTDESGAINTKAFKKRWAQFRDLFPQESAVRGARPNSPMLAEIERATAQLADWTHERINQPWASAVKKMDPEALKDAEQLATAEWVRNGKTPAAELAARHHFDADTQVAMRQRDVLFDRANRSRAYFGLDPVKKHVGPYLPREVVGGREAVSLRRSESLGGQSLLSERPGGHGEKRVLGETYREAERANPDIEYLDPRNAMLYRDWQDLKIIATEMIFKNLEKKGTLFRSESAARAASPTGKPWAVEHAPGNTNWWTTTAEEAKLLEQNLAGQGGHFGALTHYANALFRNPNLVNPAPHVLKNMLWKLTLADPRASARLVRDTIELNGGTNPTRLAEFKEAMPFPESGRSASESLQRGLARPGLGEQIGKGTLDVLGTVNEPSRRAIFGGKVFGKDFSGMDAAMRYSLFKRYREQGMDIYEAGNHAWEDLIRYGTRSTATDFWKLPFNMFVPWRFGTFAALMKQAKNHPVRAALTVGAAEYIRESIHRQTGYWWHMPTDYVQKPIAAMAQSESPGEAGRNLVSTTLTTAAFGPGGDFSAKQVGEAMDLLAGKPNQFEWMRLRNAFWGISQLWNLQDEFKRGDYGGMLGTALVGAHRAYTYEPRRLTRDLPEWLPGMQKSAGVREAETMRARRKELFERREQRREERGKPPTIEERLRAGGLIK